MNIKALITTLAIVGSSSVAMARPTSTASVHTINVSGSARGSFGFGYNTPSPVIRTHYQQPVRQPVVIRDHRTSTRYYDEPQYDEPQYDEPQYDEPRFGRPSRFDLLEESLQFSGDEYRKDIMLGYGAGRFSTLKIEGDWGKSYLLKVIVEFADGTRQQQIDLNRTLREGEVIRLNLVGRSRTISRVMVYRADGDLGVLGNHRGAFSVSAK